MDLYVVGGTRSHALDARRQVARVGHGASVGTARPDPARRFGIATLRLGGARRARSLTRIVFPLFETRNRTKRRRRPA